MLVDVRIDARRKSNAGRKRNADAERLGLPYVLWNLESIGRGATRSTLALLLLVASGCDEPPRAIADGCFNGFGCPACVGTADCSEGRLCLPIGQPPILRCQPTLERLYEGSDDCGAGQDCTEGRCDWIPGFGGAGGAGGQGGVGGSGGEQYDPGGHIDCGGWNECEDGVVTHYVSAPVPCWEWTGSCPHIDDAYVCEKGCSADGFFGHGEAKYACEEWRPKLEGDPCQSRRDCLPAEVGVYLDCDTESEACVSTQAPTLDDLWAHCAVTAEDLRPTPDGYAFGTVPAGACSGGWCVFGERETCINQGCSKQCEWHQDCPEGTRCDLRRDWSPDLSEDVRVNVCVPDTVGIGLVPDPMCPQ